MIDLIFRSPLNTAHPVNLTFGATEGGTVDPGAPVTATLVLVLPLPVYFSASAHYDNAVNRGPSTVCSATWQNGTLSGTDTQLPWLPVDRLVINDQVPWSGDDTLASDHDVRWHDTAHLNPVRITLWDFADARAENVTSPWQEMFPLNIDEGVHWTGADVASSAWLSTWQGMFKRSRQAADGWSPTEQRTRGASLPWQKGVSHVMSRIAPWQEDMPPPPGFTPYLSIPPEPPDVCYDPPSGLLVDLVFSEMLTGSPGILFRCPWSGPVAGVVIPTRKVYIVINNSILRRVDGNIRLEPLSLTLGIDVDSWAWTMSASLPGSMLQHLEPAAFGEPVELEAVVNGTAFRFLAEAVSRERAFNRSTISVRGRGLAASLDAPYAVKRTFDADTPRTAQQLASEALTVNGVGIGWDVDWQLTDWAVPGGVWSFQGSPIAAINNIATAVGGYVQADPLLNVLHLLPRYPVAPWDWASVVPDFQLPSAVTTREGIEWLELPRYNRVFVSGAGAGGVIGQVTRLGTAGDILAEMVAHQLITHADAARQRGIKELGRTGRLANVSLRLPVLPETGVIKPGKMVRYTDGASVRTGIVRSTSVDVSFPETWQSLTVETHE